MKRIKNIVINKFSINILYGKYIINICNLFIFIYNYKIVIKLF